MFCSSPSIISLPSVEIAQQLNSQRSIEEEIIENETEEQDTDHELDWTVLPHDYNGESTLAMRLDQNGTLIRLHRPTVGIDEVRGPVFGALHGSSAPVGTATITTATGD